MVDVHTSVMAGCLIHSIDDLGVIVTIGTEVAVATGVFLLPSTTETEVVRGGGSRSNTRPVTVATKNAFPV